MKTFNLTEDIDYCASSFLTYRTIIDKTKTFSNQFPRNIANMPKNRIKVKTANDLYGALKAQIDKKIEQGAKVALCLSGGIDSAILAKILPQDSMTYTFKCVVPGVKVIDETPMAKEYAASCGLKNKVIEIYWEDFEKYTPDILKHKGMPCHSIEIQIYKAALQAKKDGYDTLLFGESSDVLYGGMGKLLSQNWTFGEFVDRYSYVLPYKALKKPILELQPYRDWTNEDGYVDVHGFNSHVFYEEAVNSYTNACETASIECFTPFSNTILDAPLDLNIIRSGKNKYLVRDIFAKLYPGWEQPAKTPMPRPMDQWLEKWSGPTRPEFWPHCTDNMTGDQKWLVYILEKFLNLAKG